MGWLRRLNFPTTSTYRPSGKHERRSSAVCMEEAAQMGALSASAECEWGVKATFPPLVGTIAPTWRTALRFQKVELAGSAQPVVEIREGEGRRSVC